MDHTLVPADEADLIDADVGSRLEPGQRDGVE
jgi:hypothetical protein